MPTLSRHARFFLLAVLSLFLINPSFAALTAKRVSFKTRDGRTLRGVFKAPKPGQPTVVMLHGLASVKEEWAPLEGKLEELGWGYLAYDARGHGESSSTKDDQGSPNEWQTFGYRGQGSQWEKMIDDVGLIVGYLTRDQKLDRTSVCVAGASLGANVALNYVALTRPVKAVVLLSPGLNYQEIKTDGPARSLRETPLLLVASPRDTYAFDSVRTLASLAPKATLWTDVKPGHGVQMFDAVLLRRITEWIARQK